MRIKNNDIPGEELISKVLFEYITKQRKSFFLFLL